jgi:hypothetical protein
MPMGFNKRLCLIAAAVIIAAMLIAAAVLIAHPFQASASLPGNVQMVVGIGTHGNLSSETKAMEGGVRYFRNDITLAGSQETQLMNESRQFGAQYLGILDYATLDGYGAGKNWNLSAWNASVSEALAEYPEINTWEIWNQPWTPMFQTGFVNGSAYNYYLLIRGAYGIIKAKEPNSTVVCFGGAPIGDYDVFEWYSQVWGYGAADYCDAISIHAYVGGPELLSQDNNTEYWASGLSAYWGLTHKQIWITETGMPEYSGAYPSMFSQQLQNEFLVQDMSFFSGFPYVKRVYWYDLWGLSNGASGNNYGLLNSTSPYSGKPDAAWYSFLAIYNGSESAKP